MVSFKVFGHSYISKLFKISKRSKFNCFQSVGKLKSCYFTRIVKCVRTNSCKFAIVFKYNFCKIVGSVEQIVTDRGDVFTYYNFLNTLSECVKLISPRSVFP